MARPYPRGMSLLEHAPRIEAPEAAVVAREVFGLVGEVTDLPSERDRNFRISAGDGRSYVLKVANGTETREMLDAQLAAAELAAAAGVPVQRAHRSLAGEWVEVVDGHLVRVLDHLPGVLLADAAPASDALLHDLGATLGRLARALDGFDHPAAHRDFHWDVVRTPAVVAERRAAVSGAERHALLDRSLALFDAEVAPRLGALRRAVLHGDANDHNVLVDPGGASPAERLVRVSGLLDFGDMVHSAVAAEPAVAAAYAALDRDDPLGAVSAVVAGFHAEFPLADDELAVVWPLVVARLTLSVVNAAVQSAQRPDDPYLVVSEQPAWRALGVVLDIDPVLALCRLRDACGLDAHPAAASVRDFLASAAPAPLLGRPWSELELVPVDLSVAAGFGAIEQLGDRVGVGGYGEPRLAYTSPAFASPSAMSPERRTVHLGVDVWVPAGTPLHAPLDGVVHLVRDNDAPLDYGPVVVLEHRTPDGQPFFSLYGHLARRTLDHLVAGQPVAAGDVVAWVGERHENGGWQPHVHAQVIVDLLGLAHDYPGVALPSQMSMWLGLSPDPSALLGLPAGAMPAGDRPIEDTLADRRRLLAPSLSISYSRPLRIVRGRGAYLYDDLGRAYLDGVNNVAHVGHAHPHVVAAAARQMEVLNTNTRYLHEEVLRYAERITATLPEPLSVCYLVNSGSEANDLALRLIRAHTGAWDVIAIENGYHGHTQALIDISHYKHGGPGGRGAPEWAHIAAMPDPYRGPFRGYSREAARAYADDVRRCVGEAAGGVAGMIAESMVGCGGQVVLPDGYLAEAAAVVRAAGGLFVADEVQVGFGRVGPQFWGFATQGVVPDIVTMGKPAGNGHPLALVVTTPEVAASFANGMEYFNTFGGNPVSAAVGNAVLDVIEGEGLAEGAARVGGRIQSGLRELASRHELIGDVRGLGLYLGVELVRDRDTQEPAAAEAAHVIERMKDLGVLVSTDGPFHNVLKVKPPIVWGDAEADRLVATLDRVLGEPALR